MGVKILRIKERRRMNINDLKQDVEKLITLTGFFYHVRHFILWMKWWGYDLNWEILRAKVAANARKQEISQFAKKEQAKERLFTPTPRKHRPVKRNTPSPTYGYYPHPERRVLIPTAKEDDDFDFEPTELPSILESKPEEPFSFGGGGDFNGGGAGGSWDSPTVTAESSSQNYS